MIEENGEENGEPACVCLGDIHSVESVVNVGLLSAGDDLIAEDGDQNEAALDLDVVVVVLGDDDQQQFLVHLYELPVVPPSLVFRVQKTEHPHHFQ